MTGKELIFKTMHHEDVERAPWVPFAGVHAGKLKGYTATEVLTDADKLYESLMEVNRLYMPDGQPVVFDLQLEAEILGCELMWADDNPPSVMSHPMESEINTDKIITENDGRLPLVMDVCRRMKASVGETTALYGLLCGPFTLASHLRGTRLFMDMKRNPDAVKELMAYTLKNAKKMVDFYVEAGMDVIAPVDPLISQISPKNFVQYMAEPFSELFEYIRSKGKLSAFFVCGNALRNIEEMCKTNPDAISIDENIPMATAKAITDQYNVAIGGNIPLTTTMLFGNQMDNMKFVVDMVDTVSIKNLIIAPGCDMPYDVPMENAIAVAEAARNIPKAKELVANYEAADDDIEIEIPDYEHLERPFLEAFTLDSASCAACQYMWAVVCDAKEKYGDAIDIIEYKYNKRENIARCKRMGVTNLPTLYINGQPKYVSIIPSHEEFYAEIEKYFK
ncbi:MAG: uroporphyrinogen decarboxylase [Clostridiales bacterium]|nr:uroporphyrinogen decarboxylase [Clostridiales bacterium]MDY3747293.1 uroporphyrinogen decarboxylase family protein [Lachnospiraceae bacterium]